MVQGLNIVKHERKGKILRTKLIIVVTFSHDDYTSQDFLRVQA